MHVRRLLQAMATGGAANLLARRPWEHWGASAEEARAGLPGDEVVPHATGEKTQAVTIGAPPEAVWPWLAQMRSGRAGWYTYPWIEGGHPTRTLSTPGTSTSPKAISSRIRPTAASRGQSPRSASRACWCTRPPGGCGPSAT